MWSLADILAQSAPLTVFGRCKKGETVTDDRQPDRLSGTAQLEGRPEGRPDSEAGSNGRPGRRAVTREPSRKVRLRYLVEVEIDQQSYREEHTEEPVRTVAAELRSHLESLRAVQRVSVKSMRCVPAVMPSE